MKINLSDDILEKVIKKRVSNTNKNDYGRLLLIGGNNYYGGAIIMASEAAINAGAGLTAVATHSVNLTALHSRNPEAMYFDWHDHKLAQLISQMDVIVIGPGMGLDKTACDLLQTLRDNVTKKQSVVIDASAIDLIAQYHELMPTNAKKIVFTPHQMEWERLSQIRIPYQTDSANQEALSLLVPNKNAILVLKSNHTKIYDQNKNILVNPLGNPGMATGGMGDTLAGIIGAFLGQFENNLDTVAAAVYLHSLAGDIIEKNDYVVLPTKISAILPQLMKKYQSEN